MNPSAVRELLLRVSAGTVSVEAALKALEGLPFSDLGFARVDHHRQLRQGVPEVVYGESKTPEEVAAIMTALAAAGQSALVTRLEQSAAEEVLRAHPGAVYHPRARCLCLAVESPVPASEQQLGFCGDVLIVTAGTSDLPVAEEARLTLELSGVRAEILSDVGVAGIHRLLGAVPALRKAEAIICIAGMEGALPSVVGGLVSCPVVAVPTSVGYGAALGGLTALLGMLTSCASGVTVVNIDNGFGAAMAVLRLVSRTSTRQEA